MLLKPSSRNVLDLLNNSDFNTKISQFNVANPQFEHQEITITKAIEKFYSLSEIIKIAIEDGVFDEQLSFTNRNLFLNILSNILSQLNAISSPQINFNVTLNQNAKSYANAIIAGIMNLSDLVDTVKLKERVKGFSKYENEIKELIKQKIKFSSLVIDLDKIKEVNLKSKIEFDNLVKQTDELKKLSTDLIAEKSKSEVIINQINNINETINKSNQSVEDKKIKITSFFNLIEENQQLLLKYQDDVSMILKKEEQISALITQAETALELKSAEGISSAFSSYLSNKDKQKNIQAWLTGAIIFIIASIVFTAWIITGYGISNPNSIGAIAGRIIVVGISITGATFCAKQYVKQKNILEDYIYKSILSKSIIAFSNEIKKSDPTKVADYLGQVLAEIHKDPLRERNNIEDKNIGINTAEFLEKLVAAVKSK